MTLCKHIKHWQSIKTFSTLETRWEKLHNSKYDYSKVVYRGDNVNVTIICPIHGEFQQRPTNHSQGKGCKQCGLAKLFTSRLSDTNKFIDKAKQIHKDTYGYSKVNYINNREKVIIECKVHGDFKQRPDNHLTGNGYPECAKVKRGEWYSNEPTTLYYIRIEKDGKILYKIGTTIHNIRKRYSSEYVNGYAITLLKEEYFGDGKSAYEKEQNILLEYKDKRYNGKSFLMYGGDSELFVEDVLKEDK